MVIISPVVGVSTMIVVSSVVQVVSSIVCIALTVAVSFMNRVATVVVVSPVVRIDSMVVISSVVGIGTMIVVSSIVTISMVTVGIVGNRGMCSSRVLLLIVVLVDLSWEGSRLAVDLSMGSSMGLRDGGPDGGGISKLDRLMVGLVSRSGSHKGRDGKESL